MDCKLTCSYDVFIMFLNTFLLWLQNRQEALFHFFLLMSQTFKCLIVQIFLIIWDPFKKKTKVIKKTKGKHFQIAYL